MLSCVLLLSMAGTVIGDQSAGLNDRETAIYTALINHGLGENTPLVVIASETTGDPVAISEQEDAPLLVAELGAPPQALSDWQRRNRDTAMIDHTLALDISYRVLDQKARAKLFDRENAAAGWENFYENFGGAPGLLRLSRVGFDDRFQHALVYVELHCGEDCGSGRLVHLESAGEEWTVLGAAVVWMAE